MKKELQNWLKENNFETEMFHDGIIKVTGKPCDTQKEYDSQTALLLSQDYDKPNGSFQSVRGLITEEHCLSIVPFNPEEDNEQTFCAFLIPWTMF